MRIEPDMPCMIVHPSMWGRLVKTWHKQGPGEYTLPDGFPGGHFDSNESWIVESLGSPFDARVNLRGKTFTRKARFAVVGSRWLKPLPPPEVEHEKSCHIGEGHELLTDYAHG